MQIEAKIFGKTPAGEDVYLYTMEEENGFKASFCNIGAGIVSIYTPDKNGEFGDIVLGYSNLMYYIGDGPCFGKVPGRFANRIANGKFTLNGKTYTLPINNGPNHLHGGPDGYANKVWNGKIEGESVVFTLKSLNGDAGYPAELVAQVKYTLNNNRLEMELSATSDDATIVNLTNHSYFNLNGHGYGSVLDHNLRLNATKYLPTDSTLIPTGEFADVAGTPMDFTNGFALGERITEKFPALEYGKGYDNCWVIDGYNGEELVLAAQLWSNLSGRKVNVYTNSPGVQVYTGNWLSGCEEGKDGAVYKDYYGVAIECQRFPDTPNKTQFPSAVLNKGEKYVNKIVFEFEKF